MQTDNKTGGKSSAADDKTMRYGRQFEAGILTPAHKTMRLTGKAALPLLIALLAPLCAAQDATTGPQKAASRAAVTAAPAKRSEATGPAAPSETGGTAGQGQPEATPTTSSPSPPPRPAPPSSPSASPAAGGRDDGHEWVDLGLSVKWATCNVGASSPSDCGGYYAWGETETKPTYTEGNSLTLGKGEEELRSAGILGPSGSLSVRHDAARANWGGTWRLPTKAEWEELADRCAWTWTTQGGRDGYEVTGPNGNSVFLPAAGRRCGTSLDGGGSDGYYWSSTPSGENSGFAHNLHFDSGNRDVRWNRRYYGRSVRPVAE